MDGPAEPGVAVDPGDGVADPVASTEELTPLSVVAGVGFLHATTASNMAATIKYIFMSCSFNGK